MLFLVRSLPLPSLCLPRIYSLSPCPLFGFYKTPTHPPFASLPFPPPPALLVSIFFFFDSIRVTITRFPLLSEKVNTCCPWSFLLPGQLCDLAAWNLFRLCLPSPPGASTMRPRRPFPLALPLYPFAFGLFT